MYIIGRDECRDVVQHDKRMDCVVHEQASLCFRFQCEEGIVANTYLSRGVFSTATKNK